MPFYIKSERDGLFYGEFLGLGFFESHKKDGTISTEEAPVVFDTSEEAEEYLRSWVGGPSDCTVVACE